ncbi:FecR domain-containing protein [Reichenbachiella sp. MALMAid0571]|uniref:FecR family protein n=1 Tax=Reichenbachiella sp. MALMAid0571 TaxID=3143939 RepID=UPI0032DEA2E6
MNINHYSIEDFVSDESFIDYCLQQNGEDKGEWDDWINSHPEKIEEVKTAKELVHLFALRLPEAEYQIEKSKILETLNQDRYVESNPYKEAQINIWSYAGKIAAVLIIGVLIGIFVQKYLPELNDGGTIEISRKIIKANPSGQKSTVFLSDGSKVILNSESKIEYERNFGNGKREITLTGEAFFEVAKDKSRPFTVTTGTITTTALGTSFNIRAYENSAEIEISLATGKVRVDDIGLKSTGKETYLSPGEKAHYSMKNGLMVKSEFNIRKTLAWKEGVLYFQNDTLEDILQNLERWYGVEIHVLRAPAQPKSHFSGEFNNQSLETVLKAIGFSKNFNFDIKDKIVTIDFKTN